VPTPDQAPAGVTPRHPVRIGAAFWVQRTDWPSLRDAVGAAGAAGADDLWIDDHLLSDEAARDDPKLEGWSTLAALAAVTTRARLGLLVAAFCLTVAPFAVSLLLHPERFRNTVNAYHLYDANRFNVRQGVHEMASWVGLTARSEVYYDYFNPAFLFLTGRVLLLPLAVLLPAGLFQIVSDETTPLARLSMAGFLAAPFAASLTAEAPTPGRILFITPFAAIVSAYGLKRLLSWRWTGR